MSEINQKSLAEAYQPLFDFMDKEYGKILLVSEMDEIISKVEKVQENINELWRIKCDIADCNETASSQGMYYQEAGYICLCSKHSSMGRNKEPMPTIKQEAIERELSRDKKGVLK